MVDSHPLLDPHPLLNLRDFLQQLTIVAVQRFSGSSRPLFGNAPLAVLHFADMVLADAGHFSELFLS
jgi:hypothetical protein